MIVFTADEIYKGLGVGFKHWARVFRDQIEWLSRLVVTHGQISIKVANSDAVYAAKQRSYLTASVMNCGTSSVHWTTR